MFPVAHKTVFVIDETLSFVDTPSQEAVDFDGVAKTRQLPATCPPLPPITKSLWSCAIEAVAEYCRIVWDVYPDLQRVISFARCKPNCPPVLGWTEEDQSLPSFMKAFIDTSLDVRSNSNNSDLLTGLISAISLLSSQTPIQKGAGEGLVNRGRIICISFFRNDAHIMSLLDKVSSKIEEHNAQIRQRLHSGDDTGHLLTLDSVELVFVNSHPVGSGMKITEKPRHSISSVVSVEVHSTASGTFLSQKMISLVLKHYNLASTTVTGIPMKEEQNASTSANYDVEIVHPKEVHVDIYRSGLADVTKVPKEGCEYFSIPLKWCTPRSTSAELHYTSSACRLTPVDVNSRPSSCLTNFLLSGRTVMLEIPRSKSSRYMSHMLSAHGNELYIHSLASSRTILEDPPSISEGTGGRVTDYRINDFGEIMKRNKITLCSPSTSTNQPHPYQKAQEFLSRCTRYWPIAIGNTILFNIQSQIQPLIDLMPKESLTADDVHNCKQAIYALVGMEQKGTPLPVAGVSTKGKGSSKKDELYRILYKELIHFLSNYAVTSEHRQVVTLVRELTNTGEEKKNLTAASDFGHFSGSESPADLDNPSKKLRLARGQQSFDTVLEPQESLLSFWTKRLINEAKRKHAEFEGRKNGSNIAPLYVHLTEKLSEEPAS